jgi:predicted Abi (CAAX) family protease
MSIETAGTTFLTASRVINRASSSAYSEQLCSYFVVPRFRFVTSPMATPFLQVQNYGFGSGHFIVSNAACVIKRKKTGNSHEPCRTPIELSSSESTETDLHLNRCVLGKSNYDIHKKFGNP